MINKVSIEEFLALSKSLEIIDVRSENEFEDGHIPGAVNIPILTDEERKVVGTLYKQNGRNTAVFKGLELSGPNLSKRLRLGVKTASNEKVLVHCWRGGMRSEFYSFLLKFYGLEPILLKGGYKSFRNYAHDLFSAPRNLVVLGGKTGSGKTLLLAHLRELGEQVIDLEQLAHHRGSAFGALGMPDKPTQEQFENNLFFAIKDMDPKKPVWIEDEGRTIGDKVIPEGLWTQMKAAKMVFVERSFEERLDQIMLDYGKFSKEELIASMLKIGKRLGPQHVKRAVELIQTDDIREAFTMALAYYDKSYDYNLEKNETKPALVVNGINKDFISIAKSIQSEYLKIK